MARGKTEKVAEYYFDRAVETLRANKKKYAQASAHGRPQSSGRRPSFEHLMADAMATAEQ